jgi:hypothetical protein
LSWEEMVSTVEDTGGRIVRRTGLQAHKAAGRGDTRQVSQAARDWGVPGGVASNNERPHGVVKSVSRRNKGRGVECRRQVVLRSGSG